MKTYLLKLKGTKKNGTSDLNIHVKGDNKSQAYAYARDFFEKGKFREPFFASGLGVHSQGTIEHIEDAKELMHLAGKYFVPTTALTVIK